MDKEINGDSTNICEHAHIDLESYDLDKSDLGDLAELFKVFGDSTRISIMFALLKHELSVGDIADALDMNASAISHQLRVLKQARLVSSRREGKTVYYSLADDHVKTIFYHAMEHVME